MTRIFTCDGSLDVRFFRRLKFRVISKAGETNLLQGFEKHGRRLAASDTRGGDRVPAASPAQLVERGQDEPGARHADRMAEGHRAAVDVQLFGGDAYFLADGHRDDGKGFVHFEKIDV